VIKMSIPKRRQLLGLAPAAMVLAAAGVAAQVMPASTLRRVIPRSGESLPIIGMGTWLTFDVGPDLTEQARRRQVLQRFFAAGGGMIDSSPMYGRAQWLLGELLPSIPHEGRLFAATKVWSPFDRFGPIQIEQALDLWHLTRFDALLVHNLLNWRAHLKTLRRQQEQGRVRYIGVSTSHGRQHEEVAQLIRNEPLDLIQITYNLADIRAEPVVNLAAERGLAVVINRPFDGGDLFRTVRHQPLPGWASEIACANWAQFFLKWVVSHPAVTCAIPATQQPAHMDENMGAGVGPLPDAELRRRMWSTVAQL
jgi:diketogulonate reductase-like aldo/keto reductase